MTTMLRRLLLCLLLAVATVTASAQARAGVADDCDCCPVHMHDMLCSACMAGGSCMAPGLPAMLPGFAPAIAAVLSPVVPALALSNPPHDIWHPPRRQAFNDASFIQFIKETS